MECADTADYWTDSAQAYIYSSLQIRKTGPKAVIKSCDASGRGTFLPSAIYKTWIHASWTWKWVNFESDKCDARRTLGCAAGCKLLTLDGLPRREQGDDKRSASSGNRQDERPRERVRICEEHAHELVGWDNVSDMRRADLDNGTRIDAGGVLGDGLDECVREDVLRDGDGDSAAE